MQVIRPAEKEAPMEATRVAPAGPAMPESVLRLALFGVILVGIGLTLVMLGR